MEPHEIRVDAPQVAVDGDRGDVPLPEFHNPLPDGFLGFERAFKGLKRTARTK
jgi:hypothetical protein